MMKANRATIERVIFNGENGKQTDPLLVVTVLKRSCVAAGLPRQMQEDEKRARVTCHAAERSGEFLCGTSERARSNAIARVYAPGRFEGRVVGRNLPGGFHREPIRGMGLKRPRSVASASVCPDAKSRLVGLDPVYRSHLPKRSTPARNV